mgnify:CR=1 FL=1
MSNYKNPLARFFGFAICALALIASSTTAFSQTRDYDFDKDGKPVQVGGPGFTQQPQAAPTPLPAPKPDEVKPGSSSPTPKAEPDKGEAKKGGEEKKSEEATTPSPAARIGGAIRSAFPWILGAVGFIGVVILVVVFLRSRRQATPPPPRPHAPPPPPAPGPHAAPRPVVSPAHRPPPASGVPVRPPVAATPPPSGPAAPAPPATPAPAPPATPPVVAPIVALLFAVLFAAQAAYSQAQYTVFPSAIPVGGSINAIVTGPNANTLTGCGVALPDSGCSFSHVVSATQVMVRLTAGPNAMGTNPHPVRGTLRLVFGGTTTVNLPNAVVVGKSEQIGTAMISPHVNPAPAPAPRPTYIAGADRTARTAAEAAMNAAKNAQSANRSLADKLEATMTLLQNVDSRLQALEGRPQVVGGLQDSQVRTIVNESVDGRVALSLAPVRKDLDELKARVDKVEPILTATADAVEAVGAAADHGGSFLGFGGGPKKSLRQAATEARLRLACARGIVTKGCPASLGTPAATAASAPVAASSGTARLSGGRVDKK